MIRRLIFFTVLFAYAQAVDGQTTASLSAPPENPSPYSNPRAALPYCEYVLGVSDSEAAPLLAPIVFTSFGNSTAEILAENLTSATTVSNLNRFYAGGSYSLANVQRALATKRVARADCEQYKISAGLEAFLQHNTEALTTSALEARARVLRDALPRSEEILAHTGKAVEAHLATAQEYHGMEMRRDELLQILAQAESDLGKAANSEALAMLSLPQLLKKGLELRAKQEAAEAKLREAGNFDLSVRAGYQHIFSGPQTAAGFGTATLSFNLGRLWQTKAESRASAGFNDWVKEDPVGATARTYLLLQHFRAIQKAEFDRLHQAQTLLQDLEQRLESVREVTDYRAQSYGDYVWFDYIKTKAEHDFLVAHLKDLSAVTGGPSQ